MAGKRHSSECVLEFGRRPAAQLVGTFRGAQRVQQAIDFRRADVPTVASKKDAPRIRLLTEGAAVGAARAAIQDTRLAMGVELAH